SNDYMFINPMVMDENSDIIYMAAKNKLWRNNDIANIAYNNSHAKNDFGWEMFSDTIPNPNMIITTIETSVHPANVVYVGTKYKKIFRIDNANTGDPSLVELTSPSGANGAGYVYDIAVNPDNANEVLVVYSNYSVYSLFHSIDGGQSWIKVAGNLEQNPSGSGNGPSCRTAKIIPLGNDTLYLVGTSVGLFGTANLDGQNTVWKQVASQEIGAVVIETLTYRANDGLLVVGTHGNGIFQTNLTSANGVLSGVETVLTDDFEMNIYPNPVTSIVYIEFTLKTNRLVSFKLHDELGKLVKIGNQNRCIKGENKMQITIDNLKSGIYFVSLNLDGKVFTKQIIKK
ncbi:MAG: T9SS type A sorting domain-containing protein, partial [Flavobacteriales bacterium]|nr:T9SS type A sorting domain-containing protein [Flavobacteriales bacterium]